MEDKIKYRSKRVRKPPGLERRNYSFETKKKVVEMRYGIYGRQGPPLVEAAKISEVLHLKIQTVYTILRTYR